MKAHVRALLYTHILRLGGDAVEPAVAHALELAANRVELALWYEARRFEQIARA